MNIPPAQDSPKHILNMLDDDCICEILRRVKNIEDYLSMAEVCQRFQQCAKSCFRLNYDLNKTENNIPQLNKKGIKLNLMATKKSCDDRVPLKRAKIFLNIFGSMVEALSFKSTLNRKRDDDLFTAISIYCGKSLKKIRIFDYNPNFEHTHFEILEGILFQNSSPYNFKYYSQLNALQITKSKSWFKQTLSYLQNSVMNNIRYGSRLKIFIKSKPKPVKDGMWYMRKMPKLETFYLTDDSSTMNVSSFVEFLALNPQLKSLVSKSDQLATPILLTIGNHSFNLVEFDIRNWNGSYKLPKLTNQILNNLCALKNLTRFGMNLNCIVSFEKLINKFAENEVPIRELLINFEFGRQTYIYYSENLMTLKTLKHIYFTRISNDFPISISEMLINLATVQHSLQTLYIYSNQVLSISDIKMILAVGKHISKLDFFIAELVVDLERYESVLNLVKNRVRVIVKTYRKTKNIPDSILEANRDWLNICTFCMS